MKNEGMMKLTSVKRKANVGERILITDATITRGKYANGDVLTVKNHCPTNSDLIYANGVPQPIHTDEYVIVEDNATEHRLSEAEAEIESLKAKVDALEKVRSDKSTIAGIDFRKEIVKLRSRTPNQRRADVIKRARESLVKYDMRGFMTGREGLRAPNGILCDAEFIVNSEKRTVVCLLREQLYGEILSKGIAKCVPDDVFNADIGKEIALRRARGTDIPLELTNAPQPTEVVAGMRIAYHVSDDKRVFTVTKTTDDRFNVGDEGFFWNYRTTDGTCSIIDDTDAVY